MTAGERTRLVAILARLGSDHDGERAAAGLLAARAIKLSGLSWGDVIVPARPPQAADSYRDDLDLCLARLGDLTPRQRAFVQSVAGFVEPSERQVFVIRDMALGLRVRRQK